MTGAEPCWACGGRCDLAPGSSWMCLTCGATYTGPRLDLVAHVREQIDAGTYVTPGKLELVADRLLAAERLKQKRARARELDAERLRRSLPTRFVLYSPRRSGTFFGRDFPEELIRDPEGGDPPVVCTLGMEELLDLPLGFFGEFYVEMVLTDCPKARRPAPVFRLHPSATDEEEDLFWRVEFGMWRVGGFVPKRERRFFDLDTYTCMYRFIEDMVGHVGHVDLFVESLTLLPRDPEELQRGEK